MELTAESTPPPLPRKIYWPWKIARILVVSWKHVSTIKIWRAGGTYVAGRKLRLSRTNRTTRQVVNLQEYILLRSLPRGSHVGWATTCL